eukprot:933953-Rhodomonas_salina.2
MGLVCLHGSAFARPCLVCLKRIDLSAAVSGPNRSRLMMRRVRCLRLRSACRSRLFDAAPPQVFIAFASGPQPKVPYAAPRTAETVWRVVSRRVVLLPAARY